MPRPMKQSDIEWLGEIPADWEIHQIKNDFQIFSGATPKSEVVENWDGDIVWITPADYKTNDRYIYQGKRNISEIGYSSCGTTLVPKDSIIFSKRAPIGTVAITKTELCTNQGCLSCVPKANANSIYYYYVMSAFTEQFNLFGTGTTFKEISYDNFRSFKVPFPPLDEQQRIATFLDGECARIDSVIENTRASIVEYKKLKQAIITRAVTKGIRPARTMKQSGVDWLGDIPSDWEIKKLKYISRFMQTKYGKEDGKLNYIGLENIVSWNGKFIETDSIYDLEQSLICEAGDILFGKLRPYLAKVYLNINRQCCSGEFAVIRIDDSMCRQFFFYQLISHGFIFMVDMSTYGTKMPRANADFIKNINVVIPPRAEQEEIAQYLDEKTAAIDLLVEKKEQLLTELERLKKSLIFEYVTGKKELTGGDLV